MFFRPDEPYKILTEKEVKKIHRTSLKILAEIGIHFPNQEFLDLLAADGARVDYARKVVRFPPRLVEKHVAMVKQRGQRISRQGRPKTVEGMVGGFAPNMWDCSLAKRRAPTLMDCERALRIGNQLPQVSNNQVLFLPHDAPGYEDVWAWALALTRSRKPSGCPVLYRRSLKPIYDMACIAVGADEFRKQPLFGYQCFISSPLRYPEDALEIALEARDLGLPLRFAAPMNVAGGTSPIDCAGTLALTNAEVISGWILSHTFGSRETGYNGCPIVMDMRTGAGSYANPRSVVMNAAVADLRRFYGLPPAGGHLGDTDAPVPGIQAAAERVFTSLVSLMVGEGRFTAFRIGVLGPAGLCGCLEQMVIDAEICDMLNAFLKGVSVNGTTLAYPLIKQVGIGGNFLAEEDTVEKMRKEMWFPKIFSADALRSRPYCEIENAAERVNVLLKADPCRAVSEDKAKAILEIARSVSHMKPKGLT